MNTGRIDIDELRIVTRINTENRMSRGLWFVGRDTELLADKSIHQRGLAYVGTASDGYNTTISHGNNVSMLARMSAAATCSALRRLVSVATTDT